MDFFHKSIMLNECLSVLNLKKGEMVLDGTLGFGGHSLEMAKQIGKSGLIIGIDRDEEAIEAASKRLADAKVNFEAVHGNFTDAKEILKNLEITGVDAALLDLGISSYQIDNQERGFSYMKDARLDMRMNKQECKSAYEVINGYDKDKLIKIFYNFGEEKFSKGIAANIVKRRAEKPIETTLQLVDIIREAVPIKNQFEGGHVAKRVFQAVRIEVNNELDKLANALTDIFDLLNTGGRMAVITFHSLEEKIVKNTFGSLCKGCICPKDFPICVCGKTPKGKLINTKVIVPSEEEIKKNSRAKSAKLRAIIKL